MTFFQISDYIAKAIPVMLFAGIVFCFVIFKHLSPIKKVVLYYLGAMLFVEVLNYILGELYNSNLAVFPVYCALELGVFSYLYLRFLIKQKKAFVIGVTVVSGLYILSEILDNVILNPISIANFQPYAKVADNMTIILCTLIFLYEKMSSYNESRWDYFRFNVFVLMFFTLNAVIFLPFNFLINEKSGVKYYFWAANSIILLLFYAYLFWFIASDFLRSLYKSRL